MRPQCRTACPSFLLRDGDLENREHRVELPQDLFEPQLVSLMNDDEEHLVVGRPAMEALCAAGAEQPIELDVVRVVERTAGLFVFHLSRFVP